MAGRVASLCLVLAAAPALGHDPPAEDRIRVEKARVSFEADTRISVSPSADLRNGDWVSIKYSAGGRPREDDWVAAYAPAPADLNSTTPVKFQWATVDPGYLKTGSGQMRLRLINVRAPYTFVLMRGGMESPSASAMSGVVEFADYNEISQIHTMVTPRRGELRVQWVMRDALAGCTVSYGPSNSSMTRVAAATPTSYNASDLCGGVATSKGWRDPGAHYHAILTALEPGARVWYQIGCPGGHVQASPINATVPLGANTSASVTVAVFGDMGTAQPDGSEDLYKHGQPGTLNTSSTLESLMDRLDAVMHIGDISYARGFEVHWNEFGEQVQAVASRIPWQQGIGNHERDFPDSGSLFQGNDSGGECGRPYATRFTNPRTESAADEPWYSWNIGPVHFTIMSTEHNFTRGSRQWRWLEYDLSQVDREATPWVVFGGHRPMYIDSLFPDDLKVAEMLVKEVEPLLVKHRVDLALWGHHHSYQRTCHVKSHLCLAPSGGVGPYTAPVHMVVGMAGFRLSKDIKPVRPTWAEYVNVNEWGIGLITANKEALRIQFILNVDGSAADEVFLTSAQHVAGEPSLRGGF